jgi:hypothetical protein
MSSPPSSSSSPTGSSRSSSWPQQLAHRIHGTTQKEKLPQLCAGGFALEMAWQQGVERRIFQTPAPALRLAFKRAVIFWPGVFVATSLAVRWAEWTVAEDAHGRDVATSGGEGRSEKPKS